MSDGDQAHDACRDAAHRGHGADRGGNAWDLRIETDIPKEINDLERIWPPKFGKKPVSAAFFCFCVGYNVFKTILIQIKSRGIENAGKL